MFTIFILTSLFEKEKLTLIAMRVKKLYKSWAGHRKMLGRVDDFLPSETTRLHHEERGMVPKTFFLRLRNRQGTPGHSLQLPLKCSTSTTLSPAHTGQASIRAHFFFHTPIGTFKLQSHQIYKSDSKSLRLLVHSQNSYIPRKIIKL